MIQTGISPPPSRLAQSTSVSTAVACWGLGEPVGGCEHVDWGILTAWYLGYIYNYTQQSDSIETHVTNILMGSVQTYQSLLVFSEPCEQA